MRLVSIVCCLLLSLSLQAESRQSEFFVIQFQAGDGWVEGLRYEKQPRLRAHLEYWTDLYYKEILLMNGPWRDGTGGIFIIRARDKETVETILSNDPGISAGVINASAEEWRVLNSAMRSVKPIQIEITPDETFRLRRVDPDSPINLPND